MDCKASEPAGHLETQMAAGKENGDHNVDAINLKKSPPGFKINAVTFYSVVA